MLLWLAFCSLHTLGSYCGSASHLDQGVCLAGLLAAEAGAVHELFSASVLFKLHAAAAELRMSALSNLTAGQRVTVLGLCRFAYHHPRQ